MNIRPWGTRGSIPSPGPSTARYGGNTSCVEVRLAGGQLVILDAGSGIRPLGAALGPCEATLLLTHYHWDHIQGLPFFGAAYLPDSNISVLGPEFNGMGPREYVAGQMMTPYFPAPPSQLRGLRRFEVTPDGAFTVGDCRVRSTQVCHPGVTLGYRLEEDGAGVVYISDNEVALMQPEQFERVAELAAGADLLIHDCQYSDSEYAGRHGWGHSTPAQTVRLARAAGVKRLMLFHHDPGHTDEQVEALAETARDLLGDIEIMVGREGESITLGAAPPETASGSTHHVEPPVAQAGG